MFAARGGRCHVGGDRGPKVALKRPRPGLSEEEAGGGGRCTPASAKPTGPPRRRTGRRSTRRAKLRATGGTSNRRALWARDTDHANSRGASRIPTPRNEARTRAGRGQAAPREHGRQRISGGGRARRACDSRDMPGGRAAPPCRWRARRLPTRRAVEPPARSRGDGPSAPPPPARSLAPAAVHSPRRRPSRPPPTPRFARRPTCTSGASSPRRSNTRQRVHPSVASGRRPPWHEPMSVANLRCEFQIKRSGPRPMRGSYRSGRPPGPPARAGGAPAAARARPASPTIARPTPCGGGRRATTPAARRVPLAQPSTRRGLTTSSARSAPRPAAARRPADAPHPNARWRRPRSGARSSRLPRRSAQRLRKPLPDGLADAPRAELQSDSTADSPPPQPRTHRRARLRVLADLEPPRRRPPRPSPSRPAERRAARLHQHGGGSMLRRVESSTADAPSSATPTRPRMAQYCTAKE